MTEPVNLRQARKARLRRDKDDAAAQARALHGQTKAAKNARKSAAEKAARTLDGHRRDKP